MLDRIYGFVALARRRWVERHPDARRALARPVISIGNLTVGGTGKTPLVATVARWLAARGERPSILSRGYGRTRSLDGVTVVSTGSRVQADVAVAGDEPLMLARQVPEAAVCVATDRYLAGVLAEHALGCTVHVLDDGFQHYHLQRDLDLLVSGPGEIAGGRVLPVGRLREPMESATRAHLLIVVGGDRQLAARDAWTLGISESAGATRVLGDAYLVTADGRWQTPDVRLSTADCRLPSADRNQAVVAVAGIADPAQFFEGLRAQGWSLVRELAFPDHHVFTARDVASIADAVQAQGATLVVTTEKDAVRFETCGALPFALAVVPMTIVLDAWETVEGAFDAALERGRARVRSSAAPMPSPHGDLR